MATIATADVIVGERYRRDPGDLESLAESIREAGLLHPIVVRSDGRLVAGERRWSSRYALRTPPAGRKTEIVQICTIFFTSQIWCRRRTPPRRRI